MPFIVREMHPRDVSEVVIVHRSAFQGFFLSFLGEAFLRELYQAILNDPSGIARVCQDQTICGFVAGTSDPKDFYKRLIKRRWWRLMMASIKPALRRPVIIPRLFRALTLPAAIDGNSCRATLMSIAVLPSAAGTGVGQALIQAFLDEARRHGRTEVELTTDRNNNDRTNQFYQRQGFVCDGVILTPEGREMNHYVVML